ncbi:MAG: hypothetical protein K1X61_13380 [Chitinophagales bacterium]|nr:hypothetical protein [Chitinophagales bacterium]
MSGRTLGGSLLAVLRSLFIGVLKLIAILLAWAAKLSGTILLKFGEAIEKIVTR